MAASCDCGACVLKNAPESGPWRSAQRGMGGGLQVAGLSQDSQIEGASWRGRGLAAIWWYLGLVWGSLTGSAGSALRSGDSRSDRSHGSVL